VKSIFGMPLSMLLYTILFFVLGYFLYSFMYGALASLASRLEDINTLTMPITFMMITSFMITIFSMINNVDSPIMKVASFIPFTSPMAMFTRIAMGNVTAIEIIISVIILIVTTIGIGYLAAAIYKIGVLMYGKPPKMNEVMRALRNNRANKS
ncbi:MAG: ABC transporter permease, partial [Oscillospiraceae bacterium]